MGGITATATAITTSATSTRTVSMVWRGWYGDTPPCRVRYPNHGGRNRHPRGPEPAHGEPGDEPSGRRRFAGVHTGRAIGC